MGQRSTPLIMTPCFDCAHERALRSADGAPDWPHAPSEHLTYWTQNAFQRLFEQCGLPAVHSQPYTMVQASDVYLDRLLSRTPEQYRPCFAGTLDSLPDLVEVPTNEILVIAEKA